MKKSKPISFFYRLSNFRITIGYGILILLIGIIFAFIGIGSSGIAGDLNAEGYDNQLAICNQLYPNNDSATQISIEYLQRRQCIDQVNNYKATYYQNWSSVFVAISGISVGIGGILLTLPTKYNYKREKTQQNRKKPKKHLLRKRKNH